MIQKINWQFEDVESCELIGQFEDEYVYDIEVDDESHTFIANDILVHNSLYVSFEEVIKTTDWQLTYKDFIRDIYKYRLKDYLEAALNKYANKWNTDNFLDFELETIAKSCLFIAKKKYIQNLAWKDSGADGIHYEDLTNVKTKGFEIIQSSTPIFARKKLKELLVFIFSQEELNIAEFVKKLKEIKKEFKLSNIENLTLNLRINNYQKYIRNDYDTFVFEKGCPQHVRAAGYYNFLLNNSKFKEKYPILTNSEKVKIYFSKDKTCDVFAFRAGDFPYEIAPEMDYELQFERTILDPINRVLEVMSFPNLDRNLIYSSSLF